jgi:hypothetical protein
MNSLNAQNKAILNLKKWPILKNTKALPEAISVVKRLRRIYY